MIRIRKWTGFCGSIVMNQKGSMKNDIRTVGFEKEDSFDFTVVVQLLGIWIQIHSPDKKKFKYKYNKKSIRLIGITHTSLE